jgi:menaquinone-dependent protoporphyrinogen IX oxidase
MSSLSWQNIKSVVNLMNSHKSKEINYTEWRNIKFKATNAALAINKIIL